MERSTVRTLLLVVGSAIGGIVLFIAAVGAYVGYKLYGHGVFPEVSIPGGKYETRETVAVPPEIKERFLGTQGSYRGNFRNDRSKVLATGPGRIVGAVTSSGKPVQGLRLRLALNDGVMSDWAETDASGRYAVSVPYGRYRVDGYELDYAVVDAVLGGKTDSPMNGPSGSEQIMTLAEGKPGQGVNLAYVDPVRKKAPQGEISLSKPVVLEWQAYPGATQYEIQLTEMRDPRDFHSRRQVFECCSRPRVSGTSFNVAERGVSLKKGYSYSFDVTALDAEGRRLADSAGRFMNADFSVTE
jgi:hypothetical protein